MSLPGHVYGQQFILLTYSSWTSQSSRFLKNDRDGSKTLYPSQLVVWGIITEYQSLSLPGLVYGPTWVNYDILDIYVKKKKIINCQVFGSLSVPGKNQNVHFLLNWQTLCFCKSYKGPHGFF